jgi:hypothetical protein
MSKLNEFSWVKKISMGRGWRKRDFFLYADPNGRVNIFDCITTYMVGSGNCDDMVPDGVYLIEKAWIFPSEKAAKKFLSLDCRHCWIETISSHWGAGDWDYIYSQIGFSLPVRPSADFPLSQVFVREIARGGLIENAALRRLQACRKSSHQTRKSR